MHNVSIIGAGQLGSRHLQALKTASLPMNIFVIDNNEKSLSVAKERYDSLPENNKQAVSYCSSIQSLPKQLDLVIVATGSMPRAAIVKNLLDHAQVKYMILEKVLFPKLSYYDEISELLRDRHVICWVNCPRRMYGVYQDIKEKIDLRKPISMLCQGTDWGLCCNSIHMIDLFMHLTEEKSYSIDTTELHHEIVDSKRPGYIEFFGTISITTSHGNSLKLVCERENLELKRTITNGNDHYEISEIEGWWKENGLIHQYSIPFQSQLTGLLADMILGIGYCPLTTYENSAKFHKPFISAMLAHYNYILGTKTDLCPIT